MKGSKKTGKTLVMMLLIAVLATSVLGLKAYANADNIIYQKQETAELAGYGAYATFTVGDTSAYCTVSYGRPSEINVYVKCIAGLGDVRRTYTGTNSATIGGASAVADFKDWAGAVPISAEGRASVEVTVDDITYIWNPTPMTWNRS